MRQEKGTGYFSDTFNGRPRLLSVDSNPNAAAIIARHSSKKDNGDILNFRRKSVQGTISLRVAIWFVSHRPIFPIDECV